MPLIDPKKRITIGPDGRGNCFYLRAKMDMATEAAVIADYGRLSRGLMAVPEKVYKVALLKHNILAWSGPDYVDEKGNAVPCNAVTIGRLDPDDPLVDLAYKAIDEANASPSAPSTSSGTESSGTESNDGDEDEAAVSDPNQSAAAI